MLFANCAIIPAGFGDNRKMVRKHADSPPVFFGTDEDVDLRGEIAEDKEVILDGHRFRAEEPQAAPARARNAPCTACATVGKRGSKLCMASASCAP